MSNVMTYKGFSACVDYDDEDGILVGKVAGIQDGVGFHAESIAGLGAAFHEAVDDYVETCAKIGKDPDRPYSGQIVLRINPDVHREAAIAAELAGQDLSEWTEEALRRSAAQ
ncbi:MAG: type II toxin-antitoxin system HicB family antitoxin [Gammaproteobacteria bacterium]|nr:type II toxin-antitoxin system HicB family antitoxin [Gammaproteobacteria bacterium]